MYKKKFIAKDYSEEGLKTFIEFASSNRIKTGLKQGNIILTAKHLLHIQFIF